MWMSIWMSWPGAVDDLFSSEFADLGGGRAVQTFNLNGFIYILFMSRKTAPCEVR